MKYSKKIEILVVVTVVIVVVVAVVVAIVVVVGYTWMTQQCLSGSGLRRRTKTKKHLTVTAFIRQITQHTYKRQRRYKIENTSR